MKITPVKARSDNWMYLLTDDATQSSAVIDPYGAKDMLAEVSKQGVTVTHLLTTHHHDDHSGGNLTFLKSTPVPCYGGSSAIPGRTHELTDGQTFVIGDNLKVTSIHTPCHTQDSHCFFVEDGKSGERVVFTGDTLFTAGCGRFFEGTAQEMDVALKKLMILPEDTKVYPGHEYTAGSAKFGASVEPTNSSLASLVAAANKGDCVSNGYTIADEKKWNVFVRTDNKDVLSATGKNDSVSVVGKLREMKNAF